MKITAFKAYCEYISIRNHFTRPSYDYFKYNGKISASPESFRKRRDKYSFEKLSRLPHHKELIIANCVDNASIWIGDLVGKEGNKIYLEWLRRQESLSYVFKNDLLLLNSDFNSNFNVPSNSHPKLLELYLSNNICIETFVILLDLSRAYANWNRLMKDDIMWKDVSNIYLKYRPFLKYDKVQFRNYLKEHFKNHLTQPAA
jgi:hypothetical protein